ncbi:MAG: hypothetical protein V3W44_08995 [Dehalococcoidales bacterium]
MTTTLDIGHITGGFEVETPWGDAAPVVRRAFEDTQRALNDIEGLLSSITEQAPGNDGPVTINRTVIQITNLNADLDHGLMKAASLLDDDHPQYLRSDASDNYTNGTLTFDGGTTVMFASTGIVNFNAGSIVNFLAAAAPANPPAGTRRLFVDTGTNELSVRTSAGSTISLEAAASGSADSFLEWAGL